MGLSVSYTMHCDFCGADTGASKPTMDEIWDHVRWDGWSHRGYGFWICGDCYDPDKIYHAQLSNTFCVLCQSGEHIAVIRSLP